MTIRKTPSERKLADIKEAKGLLSLVKALRHATRFFKEKGERLEDHIDITNLPTFGVGPKNTVGIFGWETMHGKLFVIVPSDEPRRDGWEVIRYYDTSGTPYCDTNE